MFILRHLKHAARVKKKQLHAAFIDFKQAYDTVPREKLWEHFGALACLLTCCPSFKTCMQEMNMFWWMV